MNIFTHMAIAIRIKRAVEEMLPVKLKTFSFIYGNIEPDVSKSFNGIPHFKNESQDFVREEIENLLKTGYPIYMECTNGFSERLGNITHYLSDFFCHAHSDRFRGGIWKHSFYEVRLSAYCHMKFKKVSCHPNVGNMPIKQSFSAICGFIDGLLDEYSKKKPSPAGDIKFAQEACFAMCFSVLATCLSESADPAYLSEVCV